VVRAARLHTISWCGRPACTPGRAGGPPALRKNTRRSAERRLSFPRPPV